MVRDLKFFTGFIYQRTDLFTSGLFRNTTKQWEYTNGDSLTIGHILPDFVNSEMDCVGIKYNADEDQNSIISLNCYELDNRMSICQTPAQTDMLDATPKEQFGNSVLFSLSLKSL